MTSARDGSLLGCSSLGCGAALDLLVCAADFAAGGADRAETPGALRAVRGDADSIHWRCRAAIISSLALDVAS